MNKKFIILLAGLFVLILGYIGYKQYLLFNYRMYLNSELQTKLKESTKPILIKLNRYYDSNYYAKIDEVEYKKLDENFIYDEKSSIINSAYPLYVYKHTDKDLGEVNAVFKVSKNDSMYELITANDNTSFGLFFKNTNKKALLEKYNISSDYDVFEYLFINYNKNPNIFSSRDEIELNYLIKLYANIVIPDAKITLITGDITGYIYTVNDDIVYEVHVTYDKKKYVFCFFNQNDSHYFNYEYVEEFIKNIKF